MTTDPANALIEAEFAALMAQATPAMAIAKIAEVLTVLGVDHSVATLKDSNPYIRLPGGGSLTVCDGLYRVFLPVACSTVQEEVLLRGSPTTIAIAVSALVEAQSET